MVLCRVSELSPLVDCALEEPWKGSALKKIVPTSNPISKGNHPGAWLRSKVSIFAQVLRKKLHLPFGDSDHVGLKGYLS